MPHDHPIHVFINKRKYELDDPVPTGASLKRLANIPLQDVLFLQVPGEDEVIGNDTKVTLKNGDHLHSQPPADYGLSDADLRDAGIDAARAAIHPQPGGWSFLVISGYKLPGGFQPAGVDLLVKLPPGFPDAQPDMFWVYPAVKTSAGTLPRATCIEKLLGKDWQRFSWHLAGGAWQPGSSTLRDFMRCIAARLMRQD
jgi:hypothetical protein